MPRSDGSDMPRRGDGHGFRATASSLLNESGKWHPDAVERQLSHIEGDSVRPAYARAVVPGTTKGPGNSTLLSVLVGGNDCYHPETAMDCGCGAAPLVRERYATDDRNRSRKSDCCLEGAPSTLPWC